MKTALRPAFSLAAAILCGLAVPDAAAESQGGSSNGSQNPASAAPCRPHVFEGAGYTVCTVDPARDDLRLFWRDAQNTPYRRFSRLDDALKARGEHLSFAINAGMYSDDYAPVGLHIEEGRELSAAQTKTIEGPPASVPNFYKKPNGVFFITRPAEAQPSKGEGPTGQPAAGETLSGQAAGILETSAFLRRDRAAIRFATQSGPMLVIAGKLHPALIPGSSDRTWRSGVGVCEGGMVRFAVSDNGVNFHDFARLFRDDLKCPEALFLDGGGGVGLHDPATGRSDWSRHGGYGPILGLVREAKPD